MKKKLIASVLALATCFAFGGALAGCSEGKDGAAGAAGKSAYQIWLDAGNTGSEADFLASLKGEGSAACDHENILKAELAMYKHTATLNADGEWEYTNGKVLNVCADCGWSAITEEVMHDIQSNVVAPTCVAEGYTQVECTVCAYHEDKTDPTDKTGHDLDTSNPENGVAVVNGYNSCVSENGYVAFQCSNCDYVEVLNDYDRYHYVTDWKLSADGLHVEGTCSRFCKETVSLAVPAFVAENYAYTAPSCADKEPKEIFEIYVNSKVNPEDTEYPNFSTKAAEGYTKVFVRDNAKDGVHVKNGEAMDKAEYVMNGDESYADVITEIDTFYSSCAKEGKGVFQCDLCNKFVSVTTYQDHTVATWTKVDATKKDCQTNFQGTCTVCNQLQTKEPAPHNYSYKLRDNKQYVDEVCTVCGDVKAGSAIAVKSVKAQTAATCVVVGSLTVILNDGKDTEKTFELPVDPSAHNKMINGTKTFMNEEYYDMAKWDGIVSDIAGHEAYCGTAGGFGAGVYQCDEEGCGKFISVTTWRDHVAKDETTAEKPTCTKPGHVDCKVCNQQIDIDPLDPEFNYTLTTTDYVTFTLTADCKNCAQTSGAHYVVTTGLTVFDADTNATGTVFKTKVDTAACGEAIYVYIHKDANDAEIARCDGAEKVAHVYGDIVMSEDKYDVSDSKYSFISETDGNESTCKGTGTDGQGIFKCSECEKFISVVTYRQHNIDFAKGEVTAATCVKDGKVVGSCEFCGDAGEKVLKATGHELMVASANVAAGTITLGCKSCNADADTTNDFSYVLYLSAGTKQVETFVSAPSCSAEGITYYEYLFEDLKITLDVEGTDKTFEYGDTTFKFEDKASTLPHVNANGKTVTWTTTYTKEITVDGKIYIATMVVTHTGYYCTSGCGMLIENVLAATEAEDVSLRVEKVVA